MNRLTQRLDDAQVGQLPGNGVQYVRNRKLWITAVCLAAVMALLSAGCTDYSENGTQVQILPHDYPTVSLTSWGEGHSIDSGIAFTPLEAIRTDTKIRMSPPPHADSLIKIYPTTTTQPPSYAVSFRVLFRAENISGLTRDLFYKDITKSADMLGRVGWGVDMEQHESVGADKCRQSSWEFDNELYPSLRRISYYGPSYGPELQHGQQTWFYACYELPVDTLGPYHLYLPKSDLSKEKELLKPVQPVVVNVNGRERLRFANSVHMPNVSNSSRSLHVYDLSEASVSSPDADETEQLSDSGNEEASVPEGDAVPVEEAEQCPSAAATVVIVSCGNAAESPVRVECCCCDSPQTSPAATTEP